MRIWRWFLLGLLGLPAVVGAQSPPVPLTAVTPAALGYRHLVVMFGRDSVNVLVQFKKGEESVKKPLLLWLQGSLPRPLILYDEQGPFPVFAFATRTGADTLAARCHLAIIGKPGIPLVGNLKNLGDNASFVDKQTRLPPAYYCQRNYLDYYVRRNAAVLRYLKKQSWVDKTRVVVGGHSEGSSIVARLAAVPGLLTHAVYLSGSPLGRELTEVARNPADTTGTGIEAEFADWQRAVDHPEQNDCTPGDNNKNIFSHGQSQLPFFWRARVPIFIGYGTRDASVSANDYLRLEAIRLRKTNLTFRPYLGRAHNFFRLKANGQPDYDEDYWSVVGRQFLRWAGLLQP